MGDKVEAAMAPYVDAKANPTTLSNTIFSTIPGSLVYVAKAIYQPPGTHPRATGSRGAS